MPIITNKPATKKDQVLKHYFHSSAARATGNALDAVLLQTLSLWQGEKERSYRSHKKLALQLHVAPSTIGASIKRLEKKGFLQVDRTGEHKKRKCDRTLRFSISREHQETLCNGNKAKGAIRYAVADAAVHGICAAVLLGNLEQTCKASAFFCVEDGFLYGELSPTWLAEYLGCFSSKTVSRTIRALLSQGRIVRHKQQRHLFRLCQKDKAGTEVDKTGDGISFSVNGRDNLGNARPNRDENGTDQVDYRNGINGKRNGKRNENTNENKIPAVPLDFFCLSPEADHWSFRDSGAAESGSISASGADSACQAGPESSPGSFKSQRQQQQALLALLDNQASESFLTQAWNIARSFLDRCAIESLSRIGKSVTPHQILSEITAKWDGFRFSFTEPPTYPLESLIACARLLVVDAIKLMKDSDFDVPCTFRYREFVRELLYTITRRELDHEEKQRETLQAKVYQDWLAHWREVYQLGGATTDADAKPKEKAELLVKGVRALNEAGIYHEGQVHHAALNLFWNDRVKAEAFFALNPSLTMHDTLNILRECAVANLEPIEGYDERWHAKMSIDVAGRFFKAADKVVNQLKLTSAYPRIQPLS